jgi:hypothetical protein
MMSVADALARKTEQARAVFYSVVSYRHIANLSIERAVELHMSLFGIPMDQFDNVLQQYYACAREAKDMMKIPDMCRACPEA